MVSHPDRFYVPCTHHVVLRIFLATGSMVWILGLSVLFGWEGLSLFDRYGYVEMTRFVTMHILLLRRLSTGAQLHSVYGFLYSEWSIAASLRMYLHDWRIQRGIFSNMGAAWLPTGPSCLIFFLSLHSFSSTLSRTLLVF
jgi:hypothetical protein